MGPRLKTKLQLAAVTIVIAIAASLLAGLAISNVFGGPLIAISAVSFVLISATSIWEMRKIQIGDDGKIVSAALDDLTSDPAIKKLDKSRLATLRRISLCGSFFGLIFAAIFVDTLVQRLGWEKFRQSMTTSFSMGVIASTIGLFAAGFLIALAWEWSDRRKSKT